MAYAVIKTGGKQYKVNEGDILEIESLGELKDNSSYTFSEVLLLAGDGELKIGSPFISNTTVSATILGSMKGEKIRVAKFKAKSRYRRVTGHRQQLTQVQIGAIGTKKVEKEAPIKIEKPIKTSSAIKTSVRRTTKAK